MESETELAAWLLQIGATTKLIEVTRYTRLRTVQDIVEAIANRIHSSTWVVPDDVFAQTVHGLRDWAAGEFEDPNSRFDEESVSVLQIARFEKTGETAA